MSPNPGPADRDPSFALRVGSVEDLDTLCEIDLDASTLFEDAGLDVVVAEEFSLAERNRWLRSLALGRTLLAEDHAGRVLGFAAAGTQDGEPYVDQLSVRRSSMRRGIGRALLEATQILARETGAHALWLTTYSHLSWNRPYYERLGFTVVPEVDCGPQLRETLAYERRFLPRPEERVAMRKPL